MSRTIESPSPLPPVSLRRAVSGAVAVEERRQNGLRQGGRNEERIFLHSWKLSFKHPRTGLLLSFTQSLPSELADFLRDIFPKNRARQ